MPRQSYLYQHYTWPELGEVSKKQPVVVLPIGSVEDHGPHLPLDVDNFLIWAICEAAAQRAGARADRFRAAAGSSAGMSLQAWRGGGNSSFLQRTFAPAAAASAALPTLDWSPIALAQAPIVSRSQPVTSAAAFATVAQPTEVTACSYSANGLPERRRAATASSSPSMRRSVLASRSIFASLPRALATVSSVSARTRYPVTLLPRVPRRRSRPVARASAA